MDELAQIKAAVNPSDTLLVVDAMTGQEAATLVKAFNDRVDITGVTTVVGRRAGWGGGRQADRWAGRNRTWSSFQQLQVVANGFFVNQSEKKDRRRQRYTV